MRTRPSLALQMVFRCERWLSQQVSREQGGASTGKSLKWCTQLGFQIQSAISLYLSKGCRISQLWLVLSAPPYDASLVQQWQEMFQVAGFVFSDILCFITRTWVRMHGTISLMSYSVTWFPGCPATTLPLVCPS